MVTLKLGFRGIGWSGGSNYHLPYQDRTDKDFKADCG
jgi:hypothetical protein